MHKMDGGRWLMLITGLVLVAGLAGCGGKQVTRVDVGETIDLSGRWNDSDSRLMAQDLVAQVTAGTWIEEFRQDQGRKPVLIMGEPRNKTSEHIPMGTLFSDMETMFINSGRVKMVASREQREELRGERADQQDFSSPETVKRWGRELGADFMLIGDLVSIVDSEDGQEVRYYQMESYLANIEDNTLVWKGKAEVKKFIGRGKYKP